MINLESNQLSFQDAPESLRSLCLKKIIKNPENLGRYVRQLTNRRPISVLPTEVADLLARAIREDALSGESAQKNHDKLFKDFNPACMPLNRIDFSELCITEQFLDRFFEEYKDQLDEINIAGCPFLRFWDLRKLNQLKRSRQSCTKNDVDKTLIIGETASITGNSILSPNFLNGLLDKDGKPFKLQHIFDDDLRVKKLVLHKLIRSPLEDEFTINRTLSYYLTPTMSNTLKYLDLSCGAIGKGSALMQLESLEILILYNCTMTYPDIITTICHLKKLHTLDLSVLAIDMDDSMVKIEDPLYLDSLVTKLPQLKRLDISGTGLFGGKDRSISAFEQRNNNPFEFLGLFHTSKDAAFRSCLPALTIAGEANETQILNACEAYMDRPLQLSKALSDLYNLYKTITPTESFNSKTRALDVVLPILSKHINDEQVIIYTTAALWCIVKIDVQSNKRFNDTRVRRVITRKLLDVMHYHKKSQVILINGGLTLLLLPDIICEHSRLAAISLFMCQDSDERTQSFGTTLLNTLACQVGGDQKIHIGQLRAIEIMIDIIKGKIEDNACDDILETAWSTLWNITDETPVNCERFLDCDGLNAFESCMDKFHYNKEVLRNIMGLLGNVAECETLRIRFMHERYLKRFESLLTSPIDGIECSYNACGILAHIISDGQEFWDRNLTTNGQSGGVSRQSIMAKMCSAISEWPINSRRNINYRSFEPITRLLTEHIDPAAQFWAAFALANLTRINPAKYCPMLLPFDGLAKLRRLAEPFVTADYVRNLAAITIYQYDRFEQEQTLAGLEQCDSIDLEVIKSFRAEPNNGDGTSEMGEIVL